MATSNQIFAISTDINPSTTAVRYNYIFAHNNATAWNTSTVDASAVIPTAVTLKSLKIRRNGAALTGVMTYTLVVMVNGVASAASVLLDATNSASNSWTGSVSLAAGDLVVLRCTPTNTPSAMGEMGGSVTISEPNGDSIIFGAISGFNAAGVRYANMTIVTGSNSTDTYYMPSVIAGTIKKIYYNVGTAPGVGRSHSLAVWLNGASVLAATISDTNTSASNTGSQALAIGNRISVQNTPSGTPAFAYSRWAIVVTPDAGYQNITMVANVNQAAATLSPQYNTIMSSVFSPNSTESSGDVYLDGIRFVGLGVDLSTAPGVGTTRVYTLRSATADTSLTGTISETGTTLITTGVVDISAAFVDWGLTFTGAPAAATVQALTMSYVNTTELIPDAFTNSSTFYTQIVSIGLVLPVFTNTSTIYSQVLDVPQRVNTPAINSITTIYPPGISRELQSATPYSAIAKPSTSYGGTTKSFTGYKYPNQEEII